MNNALQNKTRKPKVSHLYYVVAMVFHYSDQIAYLSVFFTIVKIFPIFQYLAECGHGSESNAEHMVINQE
jgi:hypothetical protein